MCARYTLRCGSAAVAALFDLEEIAELAPRFNIAPTQQVPGVVCDAHGRRVLRSYRWGLIPRWADDPGIGLRMINARAESLAEKSAFRDAFLHRRCLIPSDGFFEWVEEESVHEAPAEPQGSLFDEEAAPPRLERTVVKQPYHIRRRDGAPFAFAGLWDSWTSEAGPLESCTIITTQPNELVRPLHDRMPAILDPKHFEMWLDPEFAETEALSALLVPALDEGFEAVAVSRLVGNPRNEDPRCVEPA
ncbi:MAG: SOS response-associated peptidase [Fimbriimonadaceae bacterium]|nr:SOS response-associated peptidase [Chthonomonadaceae bacterium]MCO5295945.1 SOS response-associated peptidase [Fimbriimonadaceae bacterium]